MAPEKQDEPTKSQSNPVKPSQTSLMTPISPILSEALAAENLAGIGRQ
jgi:hypothetical protein